MWVPVIISHSLNTKSILGETIDYFFEIKLRASSGVRICILHVAFMTLHCAVLRNKLSRP